MGRIWRTLYRVIKGTAFWAGRFLADFRYTPMNNTFSPMHKNPLPSSGNYVFPPPTSFKGSHGDVEMDEEFDMASSDSQQWMLRFCQSVRK